MASDYEELLTAKEVAEIFKVDPMTVYNWGRRGFLEAIKIDGTSRFRKSDVDRIFNQRNQPQAKVTD